MVIRKFLGWIAMIENKTLGAFVALLFVWFSAGCAAAQQYGMFPEACKAPPEGYIEVKKDSLTITETTYFRISEKKKLTDGWFEASYSAESEGEADSSPTVLRIKITPEVISIVKVQSGQRFDATACNSPNAVGKGGIVVRLDEDGGRCNGSSRFVVEGSRLTVLSSLRHFASYDDPLPIIKIKKDKKFPGRVLHVVVAHPIMGKVDYAVIDNRTVAWGQGSKKISDPDFLHKEGHIDVLQGLQPCK